MADTQIQPSQTREIEEEEEEPTTTTHQFPHFDVVSDHSDHHYATTTTAASSKTLRTPSSNTFSNASSIVHKKIMKEWKILEKDLPDTIYVRVYETRIDLMRAVIVGSAGTPYHDGLFFFDLAFPADYPNKPPLVHYHSFGLRLNPNLYDSGYVCLSLLNTWVGRNKSERWNPNESTILQVLVSLQGLVLNEKPYFNEPGIGIVPGKVKKSLAYSENVFILSCKTMIYLLRKPPKNFEGFISRHFNERGTHILTACDDYVNGRARVGSDVGENGSGTVKVSKRFKEALVVVFEALVVEFSKNGTSLGNLIEDLKKKREMDLSIEIKEEKTESFNCSKAIKEKRSSTTKKIVGRIKKFLGLKNDGEKTEESVDNGEVNKKVRTKARVDPLEN